MLRKVCGCVVLAAGLLAGCGTASDGGGSGGNSGKSFTYTITDSAFSLPVGHELVLVHSAATPCGPGGTYTGFTRTTSTLITSPSGPVVLSFKLTYSGAYLESGYVDMDGSGNLSSGDAVLGLINAGAIYSVCHGSVDATTASQTLDWTSQILPLFGGSATWIGTTQAF